MLCHMYGRRAFTVVTHRRNCFEDAWMNVHGGVEMDRLAGPDRATGSSRLLKGQHSVSVYLRSCAILWVHFAVVFVESV